MHGNKTTAAGSPAIVTRQMLAAELAHVRGIAAPSPEKVYQAARGLSLSALCLSGGGIRSAAFCLGVLQSLAAGGLLRKFDYLSTVSGGGFIGGWLQQLIREQEKQLREDHRWDLGAEERVALAEEALKAHEPPALDRLRDNTNYLTPRTGPVSPDTWAAIVLYLRNLTLNWIAFTPLFLLAALAPILYRTFIWWAGATTQLSFVVMIAAMALLGCAVFLSCHWLPSHRPAEQRVGTPNETKHWWVLFKIVGCTLAWAGLVPVVLQDLLDGGWAGYITDPGTDWYAERFGIPGGYLLVLLVSYELASIWVPADDTAKNLFRVNRRSWQFAALGSAAIFSLLLHQLLQLPKETTWQSVTLSRADLLTLVAPSLLLCILLAHSTFYIGLRREALRSDLDREWLARLNGVILGIGIGWSLFSTPCLLAAALTLPRGIAAPGAFGITGLGAIASGFASSWLGKQVIASVQSIAGDRTWLQRSVGWAQAVLPVIFAAMLFGLLASLLQLGLGTARLYLPDPPPVQAHPCTTPAGSPSQQALAPSCTERSEDSNQIDPIQIVEQLACGGILFGLILMLGRTMDVNRFSMHAVYRNRLTRAFLGTPRDQRMPEPLTGFDDQDDARLKDFRANGNRGQRLFPVINITMDITTGERAAWSERKGASFTATPLHCGSNDLHVSGPEGTVPAKGAYVPTWCFAGKETDLDDTGIDQGTHFGSMLTVSGAAASPNWGYHSSPQIAFLMTLFNVRLGAWYPNPARATPAQLQLARPRNSLFALLNELLGRSTDDAQSIYLSDGGHFENLGVYEMLRRRCTRIVVVDAGQDGDCTFFELGMMIRKAEIDLPVKIDLATPTIASRSAIEQGKAGKVTGFAYGTISYLNPKGEQVGTGEIIYIKPTYLPDAPTAVRAYAATSDTFPHETTGDQWFSESQFESYRALGYQQASKLLAPLSNRRILAQYRDRLEAVFEAAKQACALAPEPDPAEDELSVAVTAFVLG